MTGVDVNTVWLGPDNVWGIHSRRALLITRMMGAQAPFNDHLILFARHHPVGVQSLFTNTYRNTPLFLSLLREHHYPPLSEDDVEALLRVHNDRRHVAFNEDPNWLRARLRFEDPNWFLRSFRFNNWTTIQKSLFFFQVHVMGSQRWLSKPRIELVVMYELYRRNPERMLGQRVCVRGRTYQVRAFYRRTNCTIALFSLPLDVFKIVCKFWHGLA